MTARISPEAILAAADALAAHRWKTMSASSVECECGAILTGDADPFPADAAFRAHLAAEILAAVPPAEPLHELVWTDTEARPAKWRTRCGRTDVPLERAGSADPAMHHKVNCPACLRVADLEQLARDMLDDFETRAPILHRDLIARARTVLDGDQ